MNFGQIEQPRYVPYMDLSGGLNTKEDPHALDRNQLATSVNTWLGTGKSISKRPGNVPYSAGVVGTNAPGIGMTSARFGGATCVIVQSNAKISYARPGDGVFTSIGAVSALAGPVRSAQMYDPETGATTVFIVDGADVPKTWTGPGGTYGTVLTTGLHIPYNHSNAAPITPKYVTTAGFYLVYSGEPTEPTAVYISNPYYPQTFNTSATTTAGVLPNPYIPYLVGFNDGIAGGDVTGIESYPDGSSTGGIIVYKESAVYRLNQVGFFGEMFWGEALVSGSVGCVAPRSIVSFDTFRCFLGIDGVYQEDGAQVRRISDNVPTLFDSTLNGVAAAINDRTSAIGVRHGQRYILFIDDGNATNVAAGHATLGVVFDFAKIDVDGLPSVTLIRGMTPGGVAPMRGVRDDGNFVWCDSTADAVSRFGIGSSDLGQPISVTFAGKADFMMEEFGPDAPLCEKEVLFAHLLLSAPSQQPAEVLTFTCLCTLDVATSLGTSAGALTAPADAGVYGTGPGPSAVYGVSVYGASTYAPGPFSGSGGGSIYGQPVVYSGAGVAQFVALKFDPQITAQGHVVQIGFTESSLYPWTVLGYDIYVARHKVDQ